MYFSFSFDYILNLKRVSIVTFSPLFLGDSNYFSCSSQLTNYDSIEFKFVLITKRVYALLKGILYIIVLTKTEVEGGSTGNRLAAKKIRRSQLPDWGCYHSGGARNLRTP